MGKPVSGGPAAAGALFRGLLLLVGALPAVVPVGIDLAGPGRLLLGGRLLLLGCFCALFGLLLALLSLPLSLLGLLLGLLRPLRVALGFRLLARCRFESPVGLGVPRTRLQAGGTGLSLTPLTE